MCRRVQKKDNTDQTDTKATNCSEVQDALLKACHVTKLNDEACQSHTVHKEAVNLQPKTPRSPPTSPRPEKFEKSFARPEKATDKAKQRLYWPDKVRKCLNTLFNDEEQGARKGGATNAESLKAIANLEFGHVMQCSKDQLHGKEDKKAIVKLSGSLSGKSCSPMGPFAKNKMSIKLSGSLPESFYNCIDQLKIPAYNCIGQFQRPVYNCMNSSQGRSMTKDSSQENVYNCMDGLPENCMAMTKNIC